MQRTFCLYKILGVYYISIEILRPCHLFHNINGIHRRFYLFLKALPFVITFSTTSACCIKIDFNASAFTVLPVFSS